MRINAIWKYLLIIEILCLTACVFSYRARYPQPLRQVVCTANKSVAQDGVNAYVIDINQVNVPVLHRGSRIFNVSYFTACKSILLAGDRYLAWTGVLFAQSTDGLHWEPPYAFETTIPKTFCRSVAFSGKSYLVIAETAQRSLVIMESEDAHSWRILESPPDLNWWEDGGVYWDGNTFILYNGGRIYIAKHDGSWELHQSPIKYAQRLTKQGDLYFLWSTVPCECAVSRDLCSWTPIFKGITGLKDIAFNGYRYVAVGYFQRAGPQTFYLMNSTDGQNWEPAHFRIPQKDSPYIGLTSVGWDGKQFIAVGYYHYVVTSKDGIKWSLVAREAPKYFREQKPWNIMGDF